MKIVIIGGSFGGLRAAFELEHRLRGLKPEITVITKDRRFVFIPSLPWVATGAKNLRRISLDLEKPLAKRNIKFVEATVRNIEAGTRTVYIDDHRSFPYDFLVIATGHQSANEAVPGLGPFDGPGHSIMSPIEAEEARETFKVFLEDPGPLVVGCAPGASCIGPAYEFVFEVEHLLRTKGIRRKVPITFVTPEPFLGHFGVGGVGKARLYLEAEFEERGIRYLTSAAVSGITRSQVELADGKAFESKYSMIIPPLSGVKAILDSQGLGNPKGFIPVDQYYRHQTFPGIYAVGVAVALPPVEQTPVPVNFPKTGHMTEQMAAIAAYNITAEIKGKEMITRDLGVECILGMGDRAARIAAYPVRPPRDRIKLSVARRWLWAKMAFERFYLWRVRWGRNLSHLPR